MADRIVKPDSGNDLVLQNDDASAKIEINEDGTIVATPSIKTDNIKIDGNTISSDDTDGNINLTPNGTGEVNISKVDIDSGAIDGVTIGTNSPVTQLRVDNIDIDGNAIHTINTNGDIDITPNGNGSIGLNSGTIDLSVQTVDVPLNNAVDALNFDSNTLSIDASNNRIGIGLADPSTPLQIQLADNEFVTTKEAVANKTSGFKILGAGGADQAIFSGNSSTGEVRIGGINTNYFTTFYSNNTEAMRIDTSGNLKFNSGFGSVGTAYGCRAWINFDGGTNSIRGSGNVSSLTDHGTGDFQVNFSSAMPDVNYCVAGMSGNDGDSATAHVPIMGSNSARATGSVRFRCISASQSGGGSVDDVYIAIAVFR